MILIQKSSGQNTFRHQTHGSTREKDTVSSFFGEIAGGKKSQQFLVPQIMELPQQIQRGGKGQICCTVIVQCLVQFLCAAFQCRSQRLQEAVSGVNDTWVQFENAGCSIGHF